MKEVVVFGAGDFAELAGYYLDRSEAFCVSAYCVDRENIDCSEFAGKPLLPFDQISELRPCADYSMFIAIGYSKLNDNREARFKEVRKMGYSLISYVDPRACVAENVVIGENCFLFEGNNVQPFVEIGDNSILWSGNHVGHHSVIGENCFITSHVVVSGHVTIGDSCFIGVNSTIGDHVSIGSRAIIGAGSLVMKEVPERGVLRPKGTELERVNSDRLRNRL